MDKLEKRVGGGCKQPETATDLFLKWGNKKRLRCVRMRDPDDAADPSYAVSGRRRIRRRINSRFVAFSSDNNNNNKHSSHPPPSTRLTRNSESAAHLRSENNRKLSPEKEVYTTRGASSAVGVAEKPTVYPVDAGGGDQKVKHVWPKLYITLSSKEKEEDFMAMKGCKPSHRPKKRPKIIQRSLLLVSPGGWLTDLCQDRYDVIEKKSTKKVCLWRNFDFGLSNHASMTCTFCKSCGLFRLTPFIKKCFSPNFGAHIFSLCDKIINGPDFDDTSFSGSCFGYL